VVGLDALVYTCGWMCSLLISPFPGSFTFIYKYLLNALPIIFPKKPRNTSANSVSRYFPIHQSGTDSALVESSEPVTPSSPGILIRDRRPRLSLSAQATQILIRKKTRRWHAVFAGALAGGLAVMCEKAGRRTVITQQLFVRCVMFQI
jgi:hypothetical protein